MGVSSWWAGLRPKWDDDLLYLQVSAGIRSSMTASNQLKMDSEKDPMTQSINDDQPLGVLHFRW
jgi:hypothetical protein